MRKSTLIRHLWKPEPEKKGWQDAEQHVVNCMRKITPDERMEVLLFAERLALARIEYRLLRRPKRGHLALVVNNEARHAD